MRLTEIQSKLLLSDAGLALTTPEAARSAAVATEAAARSGGPVVVKAQVPFGGRGKLGAVRFAADPPGAGIEAAELLAMTLRGVRVEVVTVEPRVAYRSEFYLGVTWDTRSKLPVALLGAAGGVNVEGAGEETLAHLPVDPFRGLAAYEGRQMARSLGLGGKLMMQVGQAAAALSRAFLDLDAITAEINPIVEDDEGRLVGLDAHVEIDDDAAARQRHRLSPLGPIAPSGAARAPTALEEEAKRIDAMDHRGVAGRVVEFDGDLALLIGGGGASLTVFDAIGRHGGRPANYCEVGGNPTEEKVAALTELLLNKPGVESMAVIMNVVNNTRADVMARGLLMGLERAGRNPAATVKVFRIPGSWEQEAVAILAEAGIRALGREVSLDEAARLAAQGGTNDAA